MAEDMFYISNFVNFISKKKIPTKNIICFGNGNGKNYLLESVTVTVKVYRSGLVASLDSPVS